MTTIAFDGHTLAADSKTSQGNAAWRFGSKIRELNDGYIACAGSIAQISRFLKWYEGGREGELGNLDEFEAVLVRSDGSVSVFEGADEIKLMPGEKIAGGSGWCWAQAAMDLGKDAIEAVKYACTRDNASGGEVTSVSIYPREGEP